MLSLKAASAEWDNFPECSPPGTVILRMCCYHGWWPWDGKEKNSVCTRICCAGALYTLLLALLIHSLCNQVMNLKLLSKTLNNQRSLLTQLFASCFRCWKSYIFFSEQGAKRYTMSSKCSNTKKNTATKSTGWRVSWQGEGKERCHMSHPCPLMHHHPSGWAAPHFASVKGQVLHKHSKGD